MPSKHEIKIGHPNKSTIYWDKDGNATHVGSRGQTISLDRDGNLSIQPDIERVYRIAEAFNAAADPFPNNSLFLRALQREQDAMITSANRWAWFGLLVTIIGVAAMFWAAYYFSLTTINVIG